METIICFSFYEYILPYNRLQHFYCYCTSCISTQGGSVATILGHWNMFLGKIPDQGEQTEWIMITTECVSAFFIPTATIILENVYFLCHLYICQNFWIVYDPTGSRANQSDSTSTAGNRLSWLHSTSNGDNQVTNYSPVMPSSLFSFYVCPDPHRDWMANRASKPQLCSASCEWEHNGGL